MPTDSPIRVLHVDDEPGFADMVSAFLEREDPRLHVQTASSAAAGVDRLEETDFDCIVSDYDMPETNGLQFLHDVRKAHPDLPFILFTGKGSEEIASEAISAGITDYLQKEGGSSQYTLLAHRITNAVSQYRSNREIETSQERLSLFFERSPLGAIEWNDNLEIERINETGENILGYDEDELMGGSWRRLVPESEHESAAEFFSEIATGSAASDTEQETVTKHGERIIVEWHHRVIRNELGDVVTTFSKFQDITERVERQRQFARERAFTEQALDTLDDLFYVVDADGKLQRWNERLARATGYSDEELAGRNVLEFFPDDQRSRVADAIAATMDTGTATIEVDVLTADRGRVPYELTGKRLTDPPDGLLGLVGIGRNLSERKEREQELEFARDLLEKTERIADVGGWQIDVETGDVFWSDHLFEMLGIDGDEAPPLDEALDVYLEADRPVVEKAVEDAIAAGDPFDVEARFDRSDGDIRWFRILGEPTIEDGAVVKLRGAVQDITDHKHHEECLRKTSSRLEALYENSPDMIDVLDPDGTVLDVNSRFCEELGYEKAEVIGRPIWQIDRMTEPEDVQALLANFTAGERRKFEGRYERADGSTFPVEVHLLRLELHEKDRFLAISRDITARKQREQALQRQNDQLEGFASVVSHDLRNPLNVAEGYLEFVREECDNEQLDSIGRALTRMDALIEDLLTLAQQGDRICETEPVSLAELSAQCWQNVETADATIRTPVDGTIQADRSRLTQLLENLYRNAVEHGGAEVTITVGNLDDGFYVEDDGPGIPEDDRGDIFDAGYSTSTEGTGFGLSIVKQVVDGHGWHIRVTDGTEGGARFEITDVEFVN